MAKQRLINVNVNVDEPARPAKWWAWSKREPTPIEQADYDRQVEEYEAKLARYNRLIEPELEAEKDRGTPGPIKDLVTDEKIHNAWLEHKKYCEAKARRPLLDQYFVDWLEDDDATADITLIELDNDKSLVDTLKLKVMAHRKWLKENSRNK